jgi:hypothetical protein
MVMSYLTREKVNYEQILSLIPPTTTCTFASNSVKTPHDRRQKCTNNLKQENCFEYNFADTNSKKKYRSALWVFVADGRSEVLAAVLPRIQVPRCFMSC